MVSRIFSYKHRSKVCLVSFIVTDLERYKHILPINNILNCVVVLNSFMEMNLIMYTKVYSLILVLLEYAK